MLGLKKLSMNRIEAKLLLDKIGSLSVLSIKKVIEAYQLSLALCDHKSALHFKELYQELIYELFLKIVTGIEQEKYQNLLKHHSRDWKESLDSTTKEIFIAIILQNKDSVEQWDEIEKILNEDYINIQKVEDSELSQINLVELLKLALDQKELAHSHKKSRVLSQIGSNTEDLGLAKKLLKLIREDRQDLKDHIATNIARLNAKSNPDRSLEYFQDLDQVYSAPQLFSLAKSIYKDNPPLVEEILENIDEKYTYAYKAYVAADRNNEASIAKVIDELDILLSQEMLSINEYDEAIINVALNIAHVYPLLAYSLQEKQNINRVEELDLQALVASELFKRDPDTGIEYFHKIEVENFKLDAVRKIVQEHSDTEALEEILPVIETIKEATVRYDCLYELNKKLDVEFEKLYEVASQIMPYDDINFNKDVYTDFYLEKYGIEKEAKKLKIVHVGVGTAGVNMIDSNEIGEELASSMTSLAIDDDEESLQESSADMKVKLARVPTNGLDGRKKLEIVELLK